jgi:hypothetical protein
MRKRGAGGNGINIKMGLLEGGGAEIKERVEKERREGKGREGKYNLPNFESILRCRNFSQCRWNFGS